jgi:hypothetical protein
MTDDLELARRYISSHRQTLRMFRHHSDAEPEPVDTVIAWNEEELERELDELEAELS